MATEAERSEEIQQIVEKLNKEFPVKTEVIRKSFNSVLEKWPGMTSDEAYKLLKIIFAICMKTGIAPKHVIQKFKKSFPNYTDHERKHTEGK